MAFVPYVSPEQLTRDRSEYARKGIAKGRSVAAVEYADGILFVAENPSGTLYKISELYDRIAFAGVGRYSEFESLRIAGVQLADLRGYAYGREDVTAKMIANAYAQALANIFTTQMKPYEVEILVGEVGDRPEQNQLFHVLFDGSVTDEKGVVAMGGRSEELTEQLRQGYREGMSLDEALRLAVRAMSSVEQRPIDAPNVEAAVLDRTRPRRKFRRLTDPEVAEILGQAA
ncbi:MAG TPA: proteasome subunit alpha [Actinomycetota bacterium]|nr:proteasome subunit alpha [Actinomycetota bacterium]